ncbi:MAG: fimbrillin family protein [Muribaculaceae bacterium]|nr:fimbrillin family protein [Muribaculaceae bacterium]
MKNTTLLLALATSLALASCSEDEPVSVNKGESISFRPAMGMASRATETTNSNLSKIMVTALEGNSQYFTDLAYVKGSDGFFVSDPAYYWPGDDSELTFYSYAPTMDELGGDITINSSEKKLKDYQIAEDVADQVDFITAKGTGKKSVNETAGLELTFGHRLSQIELRAKSDNAAYTFKVAGMRIGRAQFMGTYDFDTNEWTLDDWHDTAVYTSSCDTVTLASTPVSIMGKSGNAMLMPQTLASPWSPKNDPDNVARGSYLSVLVQITTKDGARVYPFPSDSQKDDKGNLRQFAWTSVPLSGTWEQGKKYVYTLDFTEGAGNVDPDDPLPGTSVLGDAIKFTVNVENWTETDIPISEKPQEGPNYSK